MNEPLDLDEFARMPLGGAAKVQTPPVSLPLVTIGEHSLSGYALEQSALAEIRELQALTNQTCWLR